MADFSQHLISAVSMAEQALQDVTKLAVKHPKWADRVAHQLDEAVAMATRDIEFITEEEIVELENNPDDIFWAM